MIFFKKKKILVTHGGSFHSDDVFACATLSILLERQKEPFKIIRTRDVEIIKKGNYVFDIGGNKLRLIASIHFNRQKLYIRHILTHKEYDKGKWRN